MRWRKSEQYSGVSTTSTQQGSPSSAAATATNSKPVQIALKNSKNSLNIEESIPCLFL
jgi:hypothetical protein